MTNITGKRHLNRQSNTLDLLSVQSVTVTLLRRVVMIKCMKMKNMKQEQKIVNVSIDVREEQLGIRKVLTQNMMVMETTSGIKIKRVFSVMSLGCKNRPAIAMRTK